MRVVIRDLLAEVSENDLLKEVVDVDFGGDYMIQIARKEEFWEVTNAMDGWGNNCFEEFKNEPVNIV